MCNIQLGLGLVPMRRTTTTTTTTMRRPPAAGIVLLLTIAAGGAAVRAMRAPAATPRAPHQLILVRHGESHWNKEGRFLGWADIGLTEDGEEEAREAGQTLVDFGLGDAVDEIFCSYLQRSIKSAWIIASTMGKDYM